MIVEALLVLGALAVVGALAWAAWTAGIEEGWRQAGAYLDTEAYQYRMAHQDRAPDGYWPTRLWGEGPDPEERPATRDKDA